MDKLQTGLLIKLMKTIQEIEEECCISYNYTNTIENLGIFNCSFEEIEKRIMELLND